MSRGGFLTDTVARKNESTPAVVASVKTAEEEEEEVDEGSLMRISTTVNN